MSLVIRVLYTDGGMGMGLSFELQGKAVRDVVQTTFIFNGANMSTSTSESSGSASTGRAAATIRGRA